MGIKKSRQHTKDVTDKMKARCTTETKLNSSKIKKKKTQFGEEISKVVVGLRKQLVNIHL